MADPVRPFIGINVDLLPASKNAPAFIRLNAGYVDCVYAAGGLPVLIPPLNKEAELETILDRLDGVVLCGGLDLDPRRSGQPAHPAVVPMAERRELSDRILVRKAVERRMPVFGIGVGMQQLNVQLGGSLFLHLPEEQPKVMPHFDPSGGPHRHIVLVEPGSKMEEIYGAGEARVNSHHHQAVKTLGRGLRVGAKSPDGVIEAIEYVGEDWFCIGVQWHPEADTASALDMQIFESFIQAAIGAPTILQMAA
jgi:putative glutamine amidotransferase